MLGYWSRWDLVAVGSDEMEDWERRRFTNMEKTAGVERIRMRGEEKKGCLGVGFQYRRVWILLDWPVSFCWIRDVHSVL